MKKITKFINIICDLLEPQPSLDRVSLHTVRFDLPEVVEVKKVETIINIPRDYLYYQLHEIKDEALIYARSVNAN